MGVRSATASLRILKSLYDIDSVSSYNWCEFTRNQWVDSVDLWQRNKDSNALFGGPIMVLLFIYLDRVTFKYTTVPRAFPTLSSWSKEEISKRFNAEKIASYGKGGIEARLVKSSSSVPSGSGSNEHSGKGVAETSTKDQNDNVVNENANNSEQKTCPVYELERTAAFQEFASYKDFSSAEELLAALIKLETALGKRQKTENSEEAPTNVGSPYDSHESPHRGPSFDSAIHHGPVKEVKDPCIEPQQNVEETQKTTTMKTKLRKTVSKHRRKSLRISSQGVSPPSFKLLSSQSDEGDGVSGSPTSPLSSPATLEVSPVSSLPPPVKEFPPQSKRTIVISDVLKSPFRERTINVSYDITHSEKQLLDVVLCPSLIDSDFLFRSGNYNVSRGALKTLLSGERVHNTVIDTWCHILNKNKNYKSRESPSCLYLPSTMFNPIEGIDVDSSALSLV
ncbi:hypothetical protein RND81_14G141800 [Saponaria officinalis]|uniref:Uncharacterized protein n=1 Tax=Saponaria officinalis TaxID=3572 RepID=A0AAW1GLQ3_SAPOF